MIINPVLRALVFASLFAMPTLAQGVPLPGVVQDAYIKASNAEKGDAFGFALDLSGNTMVVGAMLEDSAATGVGGNGADNTADGSGAAYVYVRANGSWTLQAYLKPSLTEAGDFFGTSVAIDCDQLLVGAPGEDSWATGIGGDTSNNLYKHAGAAYLFERSGTTWSQVAYIKASNAGYGDDFGVNVAISGARMAIAATSEASDATGIDGSQTNDKFPKSGAVYAFVKTQGLWTQDAYIKPSHSGYVIQFGHSLDLDGSKLLVGVSDRGTSIGINGSHEGELFDSGASYLFDTTFGVWMQTAFMKSSNTGPNDTFGNAVGISGNLAVVAARFEGSNAVGVGGDQLDDSAYGSGAAYAFDLAATCGVFRYGDYVDANLADLYSVTPVDAGGTLSLDLTGFGGNGAALLVLSAAPAQLPTLGGTAYVDLGASLFGAGLFVPVAITAGTGQINFPITPGTAGISIFGQAGQLDPTQPSGLLLTNGLQITVCP